VPVITTNHGLHLIFSKELSQFKVNAAYLSSNILYPTLLLIDKKKGVIAHPDLINK